MSKRKKWLRGIGLTLVVLVLVGGVAGWVMYQRADRVPDWYREAQTIADDPDVEDRTAWQLQNWANSVSAGNPQTKSADDRQFTVVLTADDINRLIMKWSKSAGFEQKMSRYVRNVRVRIADGKITVGGQLVDYDRIISAVIEPVQTDAGFTELKLDSMRLGEQALPLVVLNDKQAALSGNVAKRAAAVKDQIAIDDHSIASPPTDELYYTWLASQLLAGQSADAYTFVNRISGFNAGDPVATRVKNIAVEDGRLTLTLETLDAAGSEALVAQLKAIAESAQGK